MNKIIKISAIFLIIGILAQFLWNVNHFYSNYKNLKRLDTLNDLSLVISNVLHATQQERGAASGYVGSNGEKFHNILLQKIQATDKQIKTYYTFVKQHPELSYEIETINIINQYFHRLNMVRDDVAKQKITILGVVNFYSTMNENLLSIMDKLTILATNYQLVKGLNAYANFEKAKEQMGIERAVLSGIFAKNKWSHTLYVRFITLVAKEKTFLEAFELNANKQIKDLYYQLAKNPIFQQVQKMEEMAINKQQNFHINPVTWYQAITTKLNILNQLNTIIYHYNKQTIQTIKHRLITDIVINFSASAIIWAFIIYILLLLKKENENLFNQATYDQLTGLYNRTFFISVFEIAKARARRHHSKVAIVFIDLDGFKEINDTLGHEIGDGILKEVARRLKENIRASDVIARFGGDEFLIMLSDVYLIEDIDKILAKLLNVIKEPIIVNGIKNRISASIGVSIYPDDGDDIQTLIKYADISMYKSKTQGKDRLTFYQNEMSKDMDKHLVLKNDIYSALQDNQIKLYYQPQFDKYNRLKGIDVIFTWNHPKFGEITQKELNSTIVDARILEKIDNWVFKQALIQAKRWLSDGYDIGQINCNINIRNLRKESSKEIVDIIKECNFDKRYIGLEIAEDDISKDIKKVIEFLYDLKAHDVCIIIDNFGIGNLSLALLKRLPIDTLKISGEFISNLENDDKNKAIVSAIISLAKQLRLHTIANGVNSEIERDFVFANGCDLAEGKFFATPLDREKFEEKFLKDDNEK
ncbi:MAG: diguanylate cyclase [Epsilonproteobacteria bacterium]|nr:diguanylate cyclase [Campylobacterota bacterium]